MGMSILRGMGRVLRPGSLVAVTAALFAPGLVVGSQFDSSVFVLVGSRIHDGYMPYKDVFDHKPPGVYVLNAIGQTALPWLDLWAISWLLTLVFTGAAVVLVYDLLRRRVGPGLAWAWSLMGCVGVACYIVALGGGLTESFAVLPLVAVLWVIALRPRTWRNIAGVGCALSCACLLSLQCLPAAGVLGVAALWSSDGVAILTRRAVALVGGALPLPLLICCWLVLGGAAGDAVDQIWVYNAAYRATGSQLLMMLPVLILLFGCLAIPVGARMGRMLRRPSAGERVDWVCLAWFLIYAAYILYQGRIFLHYLILMIPPLILLASQGMAGLWATLKSPNRGLRTAASSLVAVAGVILLLSAIVTVELTGITLQQAGDIKRANDPTADWIRSNTPSSATLFVWGSDAVLYLSTERAPYDRYDQQFPMITAGYWSADRTAAVLASWRASPPALIVETPSTVPMFRPPSASDDERRLDLLGPLRDFAREHYRLVASFGTGEDFDDVYAYQSPSASGLNLAVALKGP